MLIKVGGSFVEPTLVVLVQPIHNFIPSNGPECALIMNIGGVKSTYAVQGVNAADAAKIIVDSYRAQGV
jgi:hypothetical protein